MCFGLGRGRGCVYSAIWGYQRYRKAPKDMVFELFMSGKGANFIKITTHLNLQDMFRSCNDHLQLKVQLI